jgi:transcriptional regulator with XRE-family HTH domain
MLHRALKIIRVFHDLSIEELAELLNCNPDVIIQLETGILPPNQSVITCYSEIFEIPVENILFFDWKTNSGIGLKIASVILSIMECIAKKAERI